MITQPDFDNLQPEDRVRTTRWGDASVRRKSTKIYIRLYKFSDPKGARRCSKYSISEIESKL